MENSVVKPTIRKAGIVDDFRQWGHTVEPVNFYGCAIWDDCFIGPFVEIQRSVVIGKRCKIQSHAFICELVTVGDDCFISGAMFINDLFSAAVPPRADRSLAVYEDRQ